MPRKFIPRTHLQCERALGEIGALNLSAAYSDGMTQDDVGSGLFRMLSKPKPGDWLAAHEELGQTFPQYAKRMHPKSGGVLPRPACDGLLICPVGTSFDSDIGKLFMPHLLDYCTAFFSGMFIEVLEKPMSLKDVSCRRNDFGHNQYLIGDIFTLLNTHKSVISKRRAYCRLAVTLEDIYPGDEWNYVFGQARPLERVGVFSFARHSPVFYQGAHAIEAHGMMTPPTMLAWLRTCRHTMVHETCHMLGILHCVFWHCLMNGNNGPHDSNSGMGFLCPVCLRKLMFALAGVCGPESVHTIDERYAKIQAVLQELADEVGSSVFEGSYLQTDLLVRISPYPN
jgi:archaemetzincin